MGAREAGVGAAGDSRGLPRSSTGPAPASTEQCAGKSRSGRLELPAEGSVSARSLIGSRAGLGRGWL